MLLQHEPIYQKYSLCVRVRVRVYALSAKNKQLISVIVFILL